MSDGFMIRKYLECDAAAKALGLTLETKEGFVLYGQKGRLFVFCRTIDELRSALDGFKMGYGCREYEDGKFTYDYPMPSVAADVVLFVKHGAQAKQVVLIQRGKDPFKGCWAFPGGYVNIDEEPAAAGSREVKEETGIKIDPKSLYQVGTYTNPTRDPRGRVISFAFYGIQHQGAMPDIKGMDDASDAKLFNLEDIQNGHVKLAFDHKQIFDDAFHRYMLAGGI